MPFTSVRDIRMYYEIWGQGPRLLFISGTGGDLRCSPNMFDSPIARHFEILAYDQRNEELTGDAYSLIEFATAIRQKREPIAGIADCLDAMRLYEAVLSRREGVLVFGEEPA